MNLEGDDEEIGRGFYFVLLLDEKRRALRQKYCEAVAKELGSLASWFAVDSWIGGTKLETGCQETGCQETRTQHDDCPPEGETYVAFRAIATVVEMAAELSAGCVSLLAAGQLYANAVLVRQLIETEYLIEVFARDPNAAATWARSSPDELRKRFTPQKMRNKVAGEFNDDEYWQHCDLGGHPSPTGAMLLGSAGALRSLKLAVQSKSEDGQPAKDEFMEASAWGDLAQHLLRIWHRTCALLGAHHVRFATVRADQTRRVAELEQRWTRIDPLCERVSMEGLATLARCVAADINSDIT